MIPVFQTRNAVETLGNCFEACIASILELPLSAVPDRGDFVDLDAWSELVNRTRLEGGDVGGLDTPAEIEAYDAALADWLEERGLGWVQFTIAKRGLNEEAWLNTAKTEHRGYWLGVFEHGPEASHALVGFRELLVHNPTRHQTTRRDAFGRLKCVHLFTAANVAAIARKLGPELLPDLAGALEAVG